jgi:hypothetical protein
MERSIETVDTNLLGYVIRGLKAEGRSCWPAIADAAGVGRSTVEKIAYGVIDDPGVSSVQNLARVLAKRVKRRA